MTPLPFPRLISLGRHCQGAYQVRRYTGRTEAFPFDWIATPFEGLVQVLHDQLLNNFALQDLSSHSADKILWDRKTGFIYRHLFEDILQNPVDMANVKLLYPTMQSKLLHLTDRWKQTLAEEKVLCIRHENISFSQALVLLHAIQSSTFALRVELLVVLPGDTSWISENPAIHVVHGVPMPTGPEDWKGDDAVWDHVLRNFALPARPSPAVIPVSQRKTSMTTTPPLLAFQVPNDVGLGHMNRQASIALAVREIDPELRLLFIVAGDSHGLLESLSLPWVSLPATNKLRTQAGWTNWPQADRSRLATSLAESILSSASPELVVFDCFPHASMSAATIRFNIPTVLCVRNMKDYDAYLKDEGVHCIYESCRSVLVPHTEEESTLPAALRDRAIFTGPIVKPLPIDPTPIQVRLGLRNQRVVVISAGGGGHADTPAFLRVCINALGPLMRACPDIAAVLIPGPLFHRWQDLPALSGVHVLPFDPQFVDTCATADVVLAQAGYNSANELAFLGTPTLMIPADRGFDDQFERATQMAAQWPNIHTLRDPDPQAIADRVIQILEAPAIRTRVDPSEGAFDAAAHLLHLMHRLG